MRFAGRKLIVDTETESQYGVAMIGIRKGNSWDGDDGTLSGSNRANSFRRWLGAVALVYCSLGTAGATERFFTYTYEPETMPQGLFEYEQWLTARVGRNSTVGQE